MSPEGNSLVLRPNTLERSLGWAEGPGHRAIELGLGDHDAVLAARDQDCAIRHQTPGMEVPLSCHRSGRGEHAGPGVVDLGRGQGGADACS